jgi:F-type H+-transporting ATPase subunit delta
MRIPKQARRDAKLLFRGCQVDGRLAEDRVRLAVAQVLARKPRGYLAILSYFHHLVKLEVARRTARVTSAVALEPSQQAGLQARLTHLYGAGLAFAFAQDPALIGGLRIGVGSDVYDGSVQGRLTALAENF